MGKYTAPFTISEWRKAYALANRNPAPQVDYESGWFRINNRRYRERTLIEMTEIMLGIVALTPEAKTGDE